MTKNEKDTLLKDSKKVNYENMTIIFNNLKNKYKDFQEFTTENSLMTVKNAICLIIQAMRHEKEYTITDYYLLADNLVKIIKYANKNWLIAFGCNSVADNSKRTYIYDINDFKQILKDFTNGNV